MKHKLRLLPAALITLAASAQDFPNFDYTCEGQTLNYRIWSETEAWVGSHNNVSGTVIIPAKVSDGETEYTVTGIDNYAFSECSELTSVEMPNTIVRIGYSSFENCSGLTSIDIPISVENINILAFAGCTGLQTIDIPERVSWISNAAFNYCENLYAINVAESNPYYASIDGILYNKDKTILKIAPCGGYQYIKIPDGVITIDTGAFNYCNNLASVELPNSVTYIGVLAFEDCSGLERINIPENVEFIGESAFRGCTRLYSINVADSNPAYTSLNGVLYDKELTTLIKANVRISDLEIPASVKKIENYACESLIGMSDLVIPEGVETIGAEAFIECRNLQSVTFPASLSELGAESFIGCFGISNIYYNTTNPIYGNLVVWDYRLDGFTTLHVPAGAEDKFASIPLWSHFKIVGDLKPSGIDDVLAESASEINYSEPYEVYNLNGSRVDRTLNELVGGMYIVRQGAITVKIAVR